MLVPKQSGAKLLEHRVFKSNLNKPIDKNNSSKKKSPQRRSFVTICSYMQAFNFLRERIDKVVHLAIIRSGKKAAIVLCKIFEAFVAIAVTFSGVY